VGRQRSLPKNWPSVLVAPPVDEDHDSGALVFGTGRHSPEPAVIEEAAAAFERSGRNTNSLQLVNASDWVGGWADKQVLISDTSELKLTVNVPVAGLYALELGLINSAATTVNVRLDREVISSAGTLLPFSHCPDTLLLNNLALTPGIKQLRITVAVGKLSLYAMRLNPIFRALPSEKWLTVGPFPSSFRTLQNSVDLVRQAMETKYSPETDSDLNATHRLTGGVKARWTATTRQRGEHSNVGVNFRFRTSARLSGICYARTTIVSPVDREAELLIGCDWWANAFVNGEMVRSDRSPSQVMRDGAYFNGWKPRSARIRLRSGRNILLVKCQGGTAASWFTCYINDPGDLRIYPMHTGASR